MTTHSAKNHSELDTVSPYSQIKDPMLAINAGHLREQLAAMRVETARISAVLERIDVSSRAMIASADMQPLDIPGVNTAFRECMDAMFEIAGPQLNSINSMQGLAYLSAPLRSHIRSIQEGASFMAQRAQQLRDQQYEKEAQQRQCEADERAEANRLKALLSKAD